ncbi:tRNA threonylcarbamoyladenosine dehydratase [Parapusillimonas granuli]|uniref:tRNA threonylcarbamoyladenosine dehydratase n=1 Tax=Parapusillimonas granuli TaxID=380911 RepID=A0A853FZA9_9BURK|nr:tRNA threonylcarbamoyladenosine dehydratase [Parapusillimonas granuli]MBB5215109.1 tRNA A37 threonylcarbamoyladenosine dehydratase [Parapusillimonas granuli]MEB2401416.1 tRNA threonylcarbamoyladenosine dehydratase [Alcaligenaceae bacterium]NYT49427.1 tRNA threonylcarbamoyladenosine dehydratase [Parapusillimonas granuli]
MSDSHSIDFQRRFGGLERLFGPAGLERLRAAHVVVAGIGGVGSWCAEALARSGVGGITLVDLDHIAESNVNRQLHALTDTLGQAKVVAMGQRIRGINPGCRLSMVDDFISPENVSGLLPPDAGVVIDCTDQAAAKVAMILEARARGMPIVVCGGAGGKTSPLALRAGDLSMAANDALLSKLRNTLRRQHGFPRAADRAGKALKRIPRMGVRALWFDQPTLLPELWAGAADAGAPALRPETGELAARAPGAAALQGLSCAGYGSAVTVTASMGMAAANEALQWVLSGRFPG